MKVAKYDRQTGVQCPFPDATGQFIYPIDCKFFVNCWKGRAVVQPCAPGTHFNPETLECDYPNKVKCYGGELADFDSADYTENIGNHEPLLNEHYSNYPSSLNVRLLIFKLIISKIFCYNNYLLFIFLHFTVI